MRKFASIVGVIGIAFVMTSQVYAQAPAGTTDHLNAAADGQASRTHETSPIAGELVTDRPDFTESSDVVGHGVLQLESGFSLEGDRSGGIESRSITVPAVLARIGFGSRFELRLGGEGLLRNWTTTPGSGAVAGYSDFEVGAKVKLLDHGAFAMAVIPILSIPTKNANFSSGTYDSTVKFTWASPLPADFSVSGNVNVAWLSDAEGRFAQQAVSVSVSRDLFAGWGGYWEAYTFAPMERGQGTGATVNTGLSHGIGPNMQADIEVGHGVTVDAPDWFFGVGFAVRTPMLRRR